MKGQNKTSHDLTREEIFELWIWLICCVIELKDDD